MSPRLALALATCLVVGAACGGSSTIDARPDGATATTGAAPAGSIEWRDCGSIRCGELAVPRDHLGDDPTDTIAIAVAMDPADDPDERIGAILLNPGGPGAPGREMVQAIASLFPDDVRDRFDLVAWDPRGTGASSGIDCGGDLDGWFAADKSPDDAGEQTVLVDAARAVADDCGERYSDLLPYLSTTQTIEDMDALRAALGDDQLTYLGFSYGTYLGLRYAEAHPDRVRALVLDGPVDPSLDATTTAVQQSIGFERALDAFFAWCEREQCAFSPADPRGGFERLLRQIDAEELYAEVDGEERALGPGEADLGVAVAFYSGEAAYDDLADALAKAAQGDGSSLLAMADLYTGRIGDGDYDGNMAAFYAIGCLDSPRLTLADVRAMGDELAAEAPFLGEPGAWLGLPCTYWPVPADPEGSPRRFELGADTPILVTATSGDPATPIEWAEGLAEQIPAPLLVAESEQHTAFTAGDDCVTDAIIGFLTDPGAPVGPC